MRMRAPLFGPRGVGGRVGRGHLAARALGVGATWWRGAPTGFTWWRGPPGLWGSRSHPTGKAIGKTGRKGALLTGRNGEKELSRWRSGKKSHPMVLYVPGVHVFICAHLIPGKHHIPVSVYEGLGKNAQTVVAKGWEPRIYPNMDLGPRKIHPEVRNVPVIECDTLKFTVSNGLIFYCCCPR